MSREDSKCHSDNKLETISDEESNDKLEQVNRIKNMREEKDNIGTQLEQVNRIKNMREEKDNIGTQLEQVNNNELFYNIESIERLEKFMKDCEFYVDDYKLYVLLNQLIEEQNIVFATQLFVSGLIDSVCCVDRCHNAAGIYDNTYLWKLLDLCTKLGDIDRINYLEYYYNIKLIEIHDYVPKYYTDWTNNRVTNYENNKIRMLIKKIKKNKCTTAKYEWNQENGKDYFYEKYIKKVKPIDNINIIKMIFENYPRIMQEPDYYNDFIYKIISSKNKDIIEWIIDYDFYIPYASSYFDYNETIKNAIQTQVSKWQNEEKYKPNIDIDFYLYIVELFGYSKKDIILDNGVVDKIENISYKFFELMFKNSINIKYNRNNVDLQNKYYIDRNILPKIFYAAKFKRPDIYNYLLNKL
jgi:hypothetical protein